MYTQFLNSLARTFRIQLGLLLLASAAFTAVIVATPSFVGILITVIVVGIVILITALIFYHGAIRPLVHEESQRAAPFRERIDNAIEHLSDPSRSVRAGAIRRQEETQMGRPYTSSDEAWRLFKQGAELYRRFTPEDNANARALFQQAIDVDPKFARAYANLAATHRQDYYGRWSPDPESSKNSAYVTVQKGVELAESEPEPKPSLPSVLEQQGWIALYNREYEKAAWAAEEVVRRNHNSADGYILWAQVLVYKGQPQQALDKLKESSKHNPKFPYSYDYIRGQAHYVLGVQTSAEAPEVSRQHFKQAEIDFRKALEKNDNYRPARSYLVAVLSELDRPDDAKNEMNISSQKGEPLVRLLKDKNQLELASKQLRAMTPFADQKISDRLGDAWRKAAN